MVIRTASPSVQGVPDRARAKVRLVIAPDGKESMLVAAGQEGDSGLLKFQPRLPGVHIVAVETSPRVIELDAKSFNEYLVTDGLPHIYRLRAKENTLDHPGRERYQKSPKAILGVGDSTDGDPSRVIGLPLDIVPLNNPLRLKVGQALRVRVLFRGQPLVGANLGWDVPIREGSPGGTSRSDAKGEALVPIAQTGLMTVRLTHMTRPKQVEYDWESFWSTLTFWVPEN